MSKITTTDLATILLGTEHSGNPATIYEVNFAVPNSLLGSSQGDNNSGFSFGIVQLDIGVNGFARSAYTDILDDALSDAVINQTQYDRLIQYRGESRYDLDLVLSQTYLADLLLLNNTVFPRQDARDIVDQYNDQYLEQSLLGTVQNFLDAITAAWGTESVFYYNHPDYHEAVAAITSLANRFGSLNNTTANFVANQPSSIDEIRAWFDTRLPTTNEADWQLVQIGANLFSASDIRYEGVTNTISFADAVSLLKADGSDAVAELFLKSQIGNRISDVNYTGSDSAAFLVSDFDISGAMSLSGGIFLSSGGFPGSSNTSESFTVTLGTAGDADLSSTVSGAFSGAGSTQDASVLEFTVDVVGTAINGIAFSIVFGSDEFPEFSDSSFVDIAAIYVNGQNVALFNDNPATPLSVIDDNLNTGNFNDNTDGVFGTEWDGFSNILAVRAALNEGQNTIKIAIADTGDSALDSGIYVNDIELLTNGATGGGVLSVIDGDEGDNKLTVSVNPDEVNLLGGGIDIVEGTSATFNNDIIVGFGVDDILSFLDTTFEIGDIQVTFGSAILDIDTDQDGSADTKVTLEGDFEGAEFSVDNVGGNSDITVSFPSETTAIGGTDVADDIITPPGGTNITLVSGLDIVRGSVDDFFGDTIDGFGFDDKIIFEGQVIERSDIEITLGSAILAVDTDGSGMPNGSFALTGDFSDGDFMAVDSSSDTIVTFETFLPALKEGQALDPDLVNGIINQNFLKGDGSSDFQVTLRDMGFAGYNNVVGVYEIDASGNIIDPRILFENANADKSAVAGITDVEAGNRLGFFIVQDSADWAATLADSDTISFISDSGASANISDGSAISLAVNGTAVDEMVFHSFSEDLNSDGVQHALSGVEVGGEAITVGFEDLTGGGDRDYEDVVFRVEVVDDFVFV